MPQAGSDPEMQFKPRINPKSAMMVEQQRSRSQEVDVDGDDNGALEGGFRAMRKEIAQVVIRSLSVSRDFLD